MQILMRAILALMLAYEVALLAEKPRTKSMYSLPSASQIRAPSPRAATIGSPPTPRNALTGEFTPPGKISRARAITSADRISVTRALD